MNTQEFLPKNCLDKGIQGFLRPLELSTFLVGLNKFRIRDNFVTPNGRVLKCVSFIWLIIFTVLLYLTEVNENNFSDVHYVISVISFLLYIFAFMILVIGNSLFDNCNVNFILHIQEATNCLKYCDFDIYDLVIGNWFAVLVTWLVALLPEIILFWPEPNLFLISDIMYLTFDMTFIQAIRFMSLLRRRLGECLKEIKIIGQSKEMARDFEEVGKAFYHVSLAYKEYKRIFFFPIFVYISGVFVSCVLDLQTLIEFETLEVMYADYAALAESISLVWVIKNSVLIIVLCVGCNGFYETVESVNIECILMKTLRDIPKAQKRVCKNVLRSNKVHFSKITVCSAVVDVSLLLSFGQLVTTSLIVLLQFTFLKEQTS